MNIRIPLLLTALLAMPIPHAQAAPQAEFTKTSASDQALVDKMMSQSIAAYRSLRSYSDRFSWIFHPANHTQSGTIQFVRPNLVAMRVQVKGSEGSYARRIVCDGSFVWELDSRFKNRYTKRPLKKGSAYFPAMGSRNDFFHFDIARLLEGSNLLRGPNPFRVTSPPGAPTVALDLFPTREHQHPTAGRPFPTQQMTFRFDPTDHLLRSSTDHLLITGLGHRWSEQHWDIKLNPKLPDSTFRFKPTRRDRQINSFGTPAKPA